MGFSKFGDPPPNGWFPLDVPKPTRKRVPNKKTRTFSAERRAVELICCHVVDLGRAAGEATRHVPAKLADAFRGLAHGKDSKRYTPQF